MNLLGLEFLHHGRLAPLGLLAHTLLLQHLGAERQYLACSLIARPPVDERPISLEHKVRVLKGNEEHMQLMGIIIKPI